MEFRPILGQVGCSLTAVICEERERIWDLLAADEDASISANDNDSTKFSTIGNYQRDSKGGPELWDKYFPSKICQNTFEKTWVEVYGEVNGQCPTSTRM